MTQVPIYNALRALFTADENKKFVNDICSLVPLVEKAVVSKSRAQLYRDAFPLLLKMQRADLFPNLVVLCGLPALAWNDVTKEMLRKRPEILDVTANMSTPEDRKKAEAAAGDLYKDLGGESQQRIQQASRDVMLANLMGRDVHPSDPKLWK